MDKLNEFITSLVTLNGDLIYKNSLNNEDKIDLLSDIISDSEKIIEICNTEIENLDVEV